MKKTSSQKKEILNAIGKLKGNIYKGLALDRYIRKMFAPFESHKKDWRLDKISMIVHISMMLKIQ